MLSVPRCVLVCELKHRWRCSKHPFAETVRHHMRGKLREQYKNRTKCYPTQIYNRRPL